MEDVRPMTGKVDSEGMKKPEESRLTKRRLSPVPEIATLRYRCCFVFIGPGAKAVTSRITEAELHIEVTNTAKHITTLWPLLEEGTPQRTASGRVSRNSGMSPLSSSTSASERMSTGISIRDTGGTFCTVEEEAPSGRGDILRVVFSLVQSFSESLPGLADETAVCNTCFVYLCDDPYQLPQETISMFSASLAEMRYNLNRATRGAGTKKPALRAVVLLNAQGAARGSGSRRGRPQIQDSELVAFEKKLSEATKGSPVKGLLSADFGCPTSMYSAVQALARQMYKSARTPPSAGEGDAARRLSVLVSACRCQ